MRIICDKLFLDLRLIGKQSFPNLNHWVKPWNPGHNGKGNKI